MKPSHALSAELLLEHESLIRGVVRDLLPDGARVEDVVQEAWLKALERPPKLDTGGRLAAWLAAVGKHLAISSLRSEGRRRHRESAVARDEVSEDWERSLARVELRQRVANAILALREPYRDVVLLRYEEGLSPTEIGRSLDRSAATVRSQLARAHAELRERLDADFGDRRWAVLALPLPVVARTAAPGAGGNPSGTSVGGSPRAGASAGASIGGRFALFAAGAAVVAGVWFGRLPDPAPPGSGELSGLAPATPPPVADGINRPIDRNAARQHTETPEPVATVDEQAPPAPEAAFAGPLDQPRAVLFDRRKHKDYELATFSLREGLRDDPRGILGNNWDLQFRGNRFDVSMVVSDQSFIVDLGRGHLHDLQPEQLVEFERQETADTRLGHVYLVRTIDKRPTAVSAFEVLEHEWGDSCVLDWYTLNVHGQESGSIGASGSRAGLRATLEEFQRRSPGGRPLESPLVVLQARGGSVGGNECRIDMSGLANQRFDSIESSPLDLASPIDAREDMRAYFEGGCVPSGKRFVIERASWNGSVAGDNNGRGRMKLVIGSEVLVDAEARGRDPLQRLHSSWVGEVSIPAGSEASVYLEISNSSWADVRLEGRLEDLGPGPSRLLPNGQAATPKAVLQDQGTLDSETGLVGRLESGYVESGLWREGPRLSFRGKVWDLGPIEWSALRIPELKPDAVVQDPRAEPGHIYLCLGEDLRDELYRVEEADPDGDFVIDWISVARQGHLLGSHRIADPPSFVASLRMAREDLEATQAMSGSTVRLQLAANWPGDHHHRVSMLGGDGAAERLPAPMALPWAGAMSRGRCYSEGGRVPKGMVFLIEQVRYQVFVLDAPDPTPVDARIQVRKETLVELTGLEAACIDEWRGRVAIRPGEEHHVELLFAGNGSAEAVLTGRLVNANEFEDEQD